MGAGKTAMLGEASDILAERKIIHAAIDVDALGVAHLPRMTCSNPVMYENLRSISQNYAVAGVQRFLLARAIENEAELKLYRDMIPAPNTIVCRLTASVATMSQRVAARTPGIWQRKRLARISELNAVLDRARLEDFAVTNENRSLTDVALEMLRKAAWITN
jgi:adenylylsulfate kinase